MIVHRLLAEGSSILKDSFPEQEAQLDAKVLLAFVLDFSSHMLIHLHMDKEVSEEKEQQYRAFIARRTLGEPVAYILGQQNFFGYTFAVNPQVLIPRPETEVLVEYVLPFQREDTLLVDLGTGSGNIPITLAKEGVWKKVYGLDSSQGACTCALYNAQRLQAQVEVVLMDVCSSGYTQWLRDTIRQVAPKYVCITANLPYIAQGESTVLSPEVTHFEPHSALFGGESGDEILLEATKRTMEALADFEGSIALIHELDDTHATHVQKELGMITFPYRWSKKRDNEGKERFLLLEKEKTVL